jgi:hypothetical protein
VQPYPPYTTALYLIAKLWRPNSPTTVDGKNTVFAAMLGVVTAVLCAPSMLDTSKLKNSSSTEEIAEAVIGGNVVKDETLRVYLGHIKAYSTGTRGQFAATAAAMGLAQDTADNVKSLCTTSRDAVTGARGVRGPHDLHTTLLCYGMRWLPQHL